MFKDLVETYFDTMKNVQGFFNDHPIESAYRTLQQSLERIDANVAWLEHHSDEIESLLNSR